MSEPPSFPRALEAPAGPVTEIDGGVVARALDASRRSPRRRVVLPFHRHDDEALHRMLNAVQPGSYLRPHRHVDPPKAEAFVLLRGALVLFTFDDEGGVTGTHALAAGTDRVGIDLAPGIWHSFVATAPDTVIFEVKVGPWAAATDKAFAPWAPAEGTPEVAAYLADLEARAAEAEG